MIGICGDPTLPPPLPGRISLPGRVRWLAPPANFRPPSGDLTLVGKARDERIGKSLMKHWRSILLTLVALLVVVPLVLMMWPAGPLDLSNDEEPFRSMALPPKSVEAGYWMDGGSVSVHVVDQNGVRQIVSFPIDHDGILTSYKKAYWGELTDSQKLPLKNPVRAKSIMVRLYRDFGDKDADENYEFTLRKFAESPAELVEKIRGRFLRWSIR